MFFIQVFSSSVISALRPLPGASNRAFSIPPPLYFIEAEHYAFSVQADDCPLAFKRSILALAMVCAGIVLALIWHSRYLRSSDVSINAFAFAMVSISEVCIGVLYQRKRN